MKGNSLKRFKHENQNSVQMRDIEVETSAEHLPVKSESLIGPQTVVLLDQLEKAGYTAIAAKLRELQITEGLQSLDPLVKRLRAIEKHIDDALTQDMPLDLEELQQLLKLTIDAYHARAKALVLPYGTISARTAIQSNKGHIANVNVAIGIGTGVSPRPKN